jgi:hypothetical protein
VLPTQVYLYPWDVAGDPAAADTVAGLGASGAVLAAVYHATRALTPRHPAHRVVVADRTAAYVPVDGWPDGVLPLAPAAGSFGAAAEALAAAGVPVTAWAVLLHVDGVLRGGPVVVNAYGDAYPYALCAAREQSVAYACAAAALAAGQPGLAGLELEACGWYGYGHLHAHDKTGGVRLSAAADFLLSLCFCAACRAGYPDPERLRAEVRAALDPVFAGESTLDGDRSTVEGVLTDAAAVLDWRDRAGDALRERVLAAVRAVAPDLPVLLHADPVRHHTGANVGLDVATALRTADGVVLNCWRPDRAGEVIAAALEGTVAAATSGTVAAATEGTVAAATEGTVAAATEGTVAAATEGTAAAATKGTVRAAAAGATRTGRIVASLLGVGGMGGQPGTLAAQLAAAEAAGATEARVYHAGLAAAADLADLRAALAP